MKYEMSLNDFRHFMSVEENREHEEKIMAFLE
jgi:hypothetical protein